MSITKQPLPETAEELYTYELITAVTACTRTRLAQNLAIGSSGINGGGAHEVPPLSEELLAVVSYWEKSHFSSGIQTLRGYPCSNRLSHSHDHASSNKKTL